MKTQFCLSSAILLSCVVASGMSDVLSLKEAPPAVTDFPLVIDGRAARIVRDKTEPEVIRIASTLLADDIERVCGVKPELSDVVPTKGAGPVVIVGTLRQSAFISDLVKRGKLDVGALTGKWESYVIRIVQDPYPGVKSALVIAGSDRRGAAYGAVTVSEAIGVSPWVWWADVIPQKRKDLILMGAVEQGPPSVKYRGIFINDEDWGLQPWAAKTFEPEVQDIGPKTYTKVFELLLRLRANTLWPAMHECTTPFFKVPGNAETADRYAIVIGSSHAEPMLRNNVSEWKEDKNLYNYVSNRDGVLAYWEQRVKERSSGESLFTIGMRGIHDSVIVGPKSQAERIETLENIFSDQRGLLAKYLGNGDATTIGQIFCPYKEVLDDYLAGLKVPDDVTIVYPDDNFGYVRRFATEAERARSGGLGVYYHASYLGAPFSWLWIDTLPPALAWTEMMRAYEQGARTVWIVNVGDIKSTERSMEFFLDLAWYADRSDPGDPDRFLHETAVRDFGKDHADAIVGVLRRHYALAFARKPEHLGWHLPSTPYEPTTMTDSEIHERLGAYEALVNDTRLLAEKLPADAQDAFFELVGHPVQVAAEANEHYFRAELGRMEKALGRDGSAKECFARSEAAMERMKELTRQYNEELAGGKWRHMMTVYGFGMDGWRRKYAPENPVPTLDSEAQQAVRVPEPVPAAGAPVIPPDARTGDFIEYEGVISVHAGHFAGQKDAASGAGWRSVSGLGRTGSAVTVLPSTAVISRDASPILEYRFYSTSKKVPKIHVRLLPTHPLINGQGLRCSLAIDDGVPIPLAVETGFDPKSKEWKERVLANATEAVAEIPGPLAPGWHTLRLIAVDAGVVVDKIVIDLGGLRPSYDGPKESRVTGEKRP